MLALMMFSSSSSSSFVCKHMHVHATFPINYSTNNPTISCEEEAQEQHHEEDGQN
jgi:hypothetical protein